jgi:hypothetical protein
MNRREYLISAVCAARRTSVMFFVGAQRAVTLFYAHLLGNPQGLQQGLVDPRMDRLCGSFLRIWPRRKKPAVQYDKGPWPRPLRR